MTHADYYAARASEYERIYEKPERQVDLEWLRAVVPGVLRTRNVLEVACGTGYWTQYLATHARSVHATDVAEATLALARLKPIDPARVRFSVADAMALPPTLGTFDGAFCGFWWSHVPKARIEAFLDSLHARLAPGAVVLLLDNRYVEGSSTPISRRSADGDTYQIRSLAEGSKYEVLKNFPSEAELRSQVGKRASSVRFTELEYYWLLEYALP